MRRGRKDFGLGGPYSDSICHLAQPELGKVRCSWYTFSMDQPDQLKPLCVDLDGTLIKTDLLWESVFGLLKLHPLDVLKLPFWLVRGKAFLKEQLAKRVPLQPETLPYNLPFLEFLRSEKARGRPLVLATASNALYAGSISSHLGLFNAVFASDEKLNLSGKNKARQLEKAFGTKGFGYAGNSAADLPILAASCEAILVSPDRSLRSASRRMEIARTFPDSKSFFSAIVREIRVYQWVKNLIVFFPLIAAHRWNQVGDLVHSLWAFGSFSLCASSVYLINDLMDLESDRRHPKKCQRPLAAGDLSLASGTVLTAILLAVWVVSAWALAPSFFSVLFFYFALNLLYTTHLKRMVIIDVVVLACLYTLRVFAGGLATTIPVSHWLMGLCLFFFFSLALVKRHSELTLMSSLERSSTKGRGYHVDDRFMLASLGTASGFISILVFILYIQSDRVQALYSRPEALWWIPPLLVYWMSRVWLLAHRGVLDDDPILFALKDIPSHIVAFICLAIVLYAV